MTRVTYRKRGLQFLGGFTVLEKQESVPIMLGSTEAFGRIPGTAAGASAHITTHKQ